MDYFAPARLGGRSLDDCVVLFDQSPWHDFPRHEDHRWSLVRRRDGALRLVGGSAGTASGLWVAPSGDIYVVGTKDGYHGLWVARARADDDGFDWTRIALNDATDGALEGVSGTAADRIFAWGGGDPVLPNDPAQMWLFDGAAWRSVPSPGRVYAIHGAGDAIFAVGEQGLVAFWDGRAWRRMQAPSHLPIHFVFAVDGDEAYACGLDGSVYAGSSHGWMMRAYHPGTLYGIAKHGGRVLIAAGRAGFLELRDDRLEVARPHVSPRLLLAGDELVWRDTLGLVGSRDLVSFREMLDEPFVALLGGEPAPL